MLYVEVSRQQCMYLFLDDQRLCPVGYVLCRTAEEAIRLLEGGTVEEISFDHDLGPGLTGLDVANTIERLVWEGRIRCPRWQVHSANPVGRAQIVAAMISAERWQYSRSQ